MWRRALFFSSVFFLAILWEGARFWNAIGGNQNLSQVAQIGEHTYSLYVDSMYAYINEGPNISVIDITSPTTPRRIAKASAGKDVVSGVVAAPPFLYTVGREDGLRIFKFQGRRLQERYHMMLPGWAEDVIARGNVLYIADGWEGLYIVDASNELAPRVLSSYTTFRYAHGVDVVSPYAYVADWDRGLWIVDVRDPTHPFTVGHHDTPGRASKVAVSGDYAYIADGSGIEVIDVSDPAHPTRTARWVAPGWTSGISLAPPCLAVACNGVGIFVFDIHEPKRPRLVAGYETNGTSNAVFLRPPYLFVADGNKGLVILLLHDTGCQ